MTKKERRLFTEEVKPEVVRLIETSGRTIVQIAEDLRVGLSTLTRWKRMYKGAGLSSELHDDVTKELARLRKENAILRQEREILKRAATFSPGREVNIVPMIIANYWSPTACVPR